MQPPGSPSSRAGKFMRHPDGYWAFIPHPLPPEIRYSERVAACIADSQYALGALAGLDRQPFNTNLFLRPFLQQEATVSSRIEGIQADLSDVIVSGISHISKRTELSVEISTMQVLSYLDALEYGRKNLSSTPLSVDLICGIHGKLMSGMQGDIYHPGLLREEQNFIRGATRHIQDARYVPPPPERVRECLQDLVDHITQPSQMPAVVRIAVVHSQFETIHPFLDGNGRVGRILASLLLHHWALLPYSVLNLSVYLERNRQEYMERLLAVNQKDEWEEWILFFVEGIRVQADQMIRTLKRLQDLREKWHRECRQPRSPSRLPEAIDYLFSQPIFQVRDMQSSLDAYFPATQRLVNSLLDAGIVKEVSGGKRGRIYRAEKVLRIIADS